MPIPININIDVLSAPSCCIVCKVIPVVIWMKFGGIKPNPVAIIKIFNGIPITGLIILIIQLGTIGTTLKNSR